MILQLSCLTYAESIRDVWLKANTPLSCFEFVYHKDWTSICMKPLKRMRDPLVGRLNGLGLATTSQGLTCVPLQSYSLVAGPRDLFWTGPQASTRSGALDAQVQVVQCLLRSGGVCRLRVRNQDKALHRAPDHSRKQHDFFGPGSDAPDPS